MGASDLEAVTARRAAIARELAGLDLAKANLEAELNELSVTERVLDRLQGFLADDEPPSFPANYVEDEPMHRRAVGMIRSLLPRRE